MNRRLFIKSLAGAVAVAAFPQALTLVLPPPKPYDGTQALMRAIEMDLYGKPDSLMYGSALQMESLEVTLKSVTYDDTHIKLHKAMAV